MRLLIIGGTLFLGRHLVESALVAGHEVTLFNRGRTNPGLFPGVRTIRGDRGTDLDRLDGRWDAAVDTCGYLPDPVRAAATRLRARVGHYTFISSISVYAGPLAPGAGEDAPVQSVDDELTHEFRPEHYGALKRRCEEAAEEVMPGRVLHVRAGLLVGPHDPTHRFSYWVDRIGAGGEVLAPGDPARRVQFVHTRDLADWTIRAVEAGVVGPVNVTGPPGGASMGAMLEVMRRTLCPDARLTWVDEPFLVERGVAPWKDLPLWLPEDQNGMLDVGIDRAVRTRLVCRPLERTVRETADWLPEARRAEGALASGAAKGAGLSSEREAELLRAWHGRESGERA